MITRTWYELGRLFGWAAITLIASGLVVATALRALGVGSGLLALLAG